MGKVAEAVINRVKVPVLLLYFNYGSTCYGSTCFGSACCGST